jgi:glutamyl-tRNA synthetase
MGITRIAPTPSGFLHAGNGLSFLFTYALARAQGDQILLRIDDLDAARTRVDYLDDIFRTLDWLDISWDLGPVSVVDFQKNWSQHHRLPLYQAALEVLKNDTQSGQVYACTCSRKQIQETSDTGLYPRTCRHRHIPFDAQDAAWRIKIDATEKAQFKNFDFQYRNFKRETVVLADTVGDFVVQQKNQFPAYQLASVVDDSHFGITRIVRGQDLWCSTAAQIHLARHLNLASFQQIAFYHHPILTDALGHKLSKSKGANALATAREKGQNAEDLVKEIGNWFSPKVAMANVTDLIRFLASNTHPILEGGRGQ